MKYSLIDKWVIDFCHDNNYKEKDIVVEVFPQGVSLEGKLRQVQVTVIRERNFETVDVYFDEDYRYTVYDPNETFMNDLKNHELQIYEKNY